MKAVTILTIKQFNNVKFPVLIKFKGLNKTAVLIIYNERISVG